jgi:hypothetical protein
MSDPNFYRKYECNLESYNIKALTKLRCAACELGNAQCDSLSYSPSGIKTYNGEFSMSASYLFNFINLPPLLNSACNGELTLFLNNGLYANVTSAIIIKTGGTILQSLIYQRVGNFDSVVMYITAGGNEIMVDVTPAAVCKWIYRGI